VALSGQSVKEGKRAFAGSHAHESMIGTALGRQSDPTRNTAPPRVPVLAALPVSGGRTVYQVLLVRQFRRSLIQP
jgi:hypothetical protein